MAKNSRPLLPSEYKIVTDCLVRKWYFDLQPTPAPPAKLFFMTRIIKMCGEVAEGRIIDRKKLYGLAGAHLVTNAFLESITRVVEHLEPSFELRVHLALRRQVLRIMCTLPDDAIVDNADKVDKMQLLATEDCWDRLNPIDFVRLGSLVFDRVFEAAVVVQEVAAQGWAAAPLLLVSTALSGISSVTWNSEEARPDSTDRINDSWNRLENLFIFGTDDDLRREVVSLGLRKYILEEYDKAQADLANLETGLPDRRRRDYSRRTGGFISNFIAESRGAFEHVFFALGGGVGFAQLQRMSNSLVSFIWQNWDILWVAERIAGQLSRLDAYYDLLDLVSASSILVPEPPAAYLPAHTGARGMALKFKTRKPTQGTVEVNGRDLDDYEREDLASRMAFTFQTSPALPFTIREYVGLGSIKHRGDSDRIENALKKADACTVVADLACGWHTYAGGAAGSTLDGEFYLPRVIPVRSVQPSVAVVVEKKPKKEEVESEDEDEDKKENPDEISEPEESLREKLDVKICDEPVRTLRRKDPDGQDVEVSFPRHAPDAPVLSGGQWQCIALSRTLMDDSKDLLVFDEPAASLDPAAEAALFDTIRSLKGSTTILFSTHRYGITKEADLILMFSKGELVEQGSHDDLMQIEGGEYRRMFTFSAQGFATAKTEVVDAGDVEV